MKFIVSFVSTLLLILVVANDVAGKESVAELRRLRALGGHGRGWHGGDNGRDHPNIYNNHNRTSSSDVSISF